ncbi:MAG: hypothetical protein IJA32_00805 [Lachnospiraceae bacterium]|nr:hypothetical protein [Lachnospiraceae bacterium]
MKKANINFILAMVVVVAVLLISFTVWRAVSKADKELEQIESSINEKRQGDEIGDVEGYGIIMESFGYLIGGLGVIALKLALIFLTGYAALLFLVALIARLVYKNSGGRLLAYRIMMGIEYALQALMEVILILSVIELPTVSNVLATILLGADIIFSARNTYTARICM